MHTPQRVESGFLAWLPVIGLAFAAFVFNTSEFLPVGLLPDMAESLNENVSFTGLVITGYAWVVAVMSLPLTILTAKFERRKLLLCLLAIFACCHFVIIFVDSFATLLAARIGVALTHSVFWSIMTPLAARMAPKGKRAVGIAAVMGGTIVATVMGVPIGTQLGHTFGWQEAFFIIGIVAALVLAVIYFVLPGCEATKAGNLKSLPVIFKRPALVQLYLLTAIGILGQFTAYSYFSPILQHAGGFSESDVVTALFVFGISGVIGTVVSSKTVDKHTSMSLCVPLCLVFFCLLLLEPAAQSWWTLAPVIVLWGAAMTAVGMAFQTIVLNTAPDAADVATSLYSGIYNVGIGGGAFLGSQISQAWGFSPVAYAGAAIVAAVTIPTLVIYWKTGSAVLPGAPDLARRPATGEPLKISPDAEK